MNTASDSIAVLFQESWTRFQQKTASIAQTKHELEMDAQSFTEKHDENAYIRAEKVIKDIIARSVFNTSGTMDDFTMNNPSTTIKLADMHEDTTGQHDYYEKATGPLKRALVKKISNLYTVQFDRFFNQNISEFKLRKIKAPPRVRKSAAATQDSFMCRVEPTHKMRVADAAILVANDRADKMVAAEDAAKQKHEQELALDAELDTEISASEAEMLRINSMLKLQETKHADLDKKRKVQWKNTHNSEAALQQATTNKIDSFEEVNKAIRTQQTLHMNCSYDSNPMITPSRCIAVPSTRPGIAINNRHRGRIATPRPIGIGIEVTEEDVGRKRGRANSTGTDSDSDYVENDDSQ